MEDRQVPDIVVGRLPIYLRALTFLKADSREITSSQELGDRLGISSAQIRKDLSHFGEFGKQGTGYDIKHLESNLKEILHVDRMWDVVVVGAGDLGHALAGYRGFAGRGFRITAVFDKDPAKIGQTLPSGLVIEDVASLAERVKETHGTSRSSRCRLKKRNRLPTRSSSWGSRRYSTTPRFHSSSHLASASNRSIRRCICST